MSVRLFCASIPRAKSEPNGKDVTTTESFMFNLSNPMMNNRPLPGAPGIAALTKTRSTPRSK